MHWFSVVIQEYLGFLRQLACRPLACMGLGIIDSEDELISMRPVYILSGIVDLPTTPASSKYVFVSMHVLTMTGM